MKKFSLVWLEDTGYGKQGAKEKPKRDQGSYVTREQPGSDPLFHQEQVQKLEKFLEQMIEGNGKQQRQTGCEGYYHLMQYFRSAYCPSPLNSYEHSLLVTRGGVHFTRHCICRLPHLSQVLRVLY